MRKVFALALMLGLAAGCTPAAQPASPLVYVDVSPGHGSGVHIGHGLFVTAAHVADKARDSKVSINTAAGAELEGEVLWLNQMYDVALVKTATPPGISSARLDCKAPELAVGTEIHGTGHPLMLMNVRTWGRVARVTEHSPDKTEVPRVAFIADMTIAPGDSGGPVFTRYGRFAGIMVAFTTMNYGFVQVPIPLSYVVPTSALCTLLGRG